MFDQDVHHDICPWYDYKMILKNFVRVNKTK